MQIDTSIAAIVTGGASGLGEATARALAAKGAKVALFDLNEERGEAVAAEIGGVFCKVDVSDEASIEAGFARAREAHGQERVLVNCAGIATVGKTTKRDRETGAISHLPLAAFEKTIRINLMGTFNCMAKAAAGMITLDTVGEYGERGVIINTASVAAEDGQIGQVAYATSKAGVKGMTLPAARDLMGEGIRVNAILPGIFHTPMMDGLPEKAQVALAASVPFPKRLGRPEEYAKLACFMVETEYMNAETVRLDGAIRMPPK
ncbi:SDR family NAD(P)-dependent oxidoreductase [Aurantiacibacter gangjinensis]|uniref:3-hydroxy-2-methylbutyryl-CoA dehydrogenase n=1 Tax=Aurantiacibacter gangjinensis TaxID=502682 RepID=A0A0G9MW45_9SPHN|nr:SDR family NAD(P)-dependent oxidoreductase [Aurantiacibacter gangjinensis]APE27076.1 3-oxoacyl-[acyl-carrier protein] reductase [Aurantiacibacter gangjinensis]KLE33498.1 3-hydroxy-2-methylbutyryl-CoA dehydrogenase [Aurantiacibacter gangjinensis]